VFGHWHTDEFRVLAHEAEGQWWASASTPVLVTGSISPYYSNNPSFRIIEYDDATFEVFPTFSSRLNSQFLSIPSPLSLASF
jgi:hypothetical protein